MQHLEARVVGEVQVIDDHRGEAGALRVADQGFNRAMQQQLLSETDLGDDGAVDLRHHAREFAALRSIEQRRAVLDQRAQRAAEAGVRHTGVAGPCRHDKRIGRIVRSEGFGNELADQPRLAQPGLAEQPEHAPGRPRREQAPAFAFATDQAWRTQHAGRNRAPRQRQRSTRGADRRQQLGACRPRYAALVGLQRRDEALECINRRRALAVEVAQLHQPLHCRLVERVGADQALRQRRTFGIAPLALAGVDALDVARAPPPGERAALGIEPALEVGAIGVVVGREQFSAGIAIKIMRDPGGERQQLATRDHVGAGRAAQPEQALAQCVAPGLRLPPGPQQLQQPLPRRGAFDRQHRQQRGVESRQRHRRRVAATHGDGSAGERQLQRRVARRAVVDD